MVQLTRFLVVFSAAALGCAAVLLKDGSMKAVEWDLHLILLHAQATSTSVSVIPATNVTLLDANNIHRYGAPMTDDIAATATDILAFKKLTVAHAQTIIKSLKPILKFIRTIAKDIVTKKAGLETVPGGIPAFVCPDLKRLNVKTAAMFDALEKKAPVHFLAELQIVGGITFRELDAAVSEYC
ncbi:hypothetical protein B0H14DRAFT_1193829 [Mycena olivaceomarginata]|nr:hypothetical protein B0H14DRAFT_1193829 [Mycena olivaceomarginata]